jgi:3-phenylpropionate/cinnamic acid dioxygenase small subunit
MSDLPNGEVADSDYVAIQRFLYREASLLDRLAFQDWLRLLTDDVSYRVTARVVRTRDEGHGDYTIVDEDATSLKARVTQIANPKLTHAENPAAFTRRFVSNFQTFRAASSEEFGVESHLLVYRAKVSAPEGALYVGERHDVLRRVDGGFRIARREVRLDHAILFDGVVSTIF